MEQAAIIILLILAVPLAVIIWLIARAVSSQNQIEDLSRRMDILQGEFHRFKGAGEAHEKTVEEKIAAFSPANLPPKREYEPAKPPPHVPQQSAVPPLVSEPAVPDLFPTTLAAAKTAAAESYLRKETPATPSPIQPPPYVPKHVPPVFSPSDMAFPEPETAAAAADEKDSFEMRVGKYWVVRIGIVIILASLAFGANLAYHQIVPRLGPAGKISMLYLASALLLGAGAWFQRGKLKESLKNYGQVLFAGGLAAVYFTTYAAHYAPPVCVIQSALIDGTLLLLWAGVIAWIADWRKSEIMALFAVGLAFFTSVITRVGEFTLYSNLILTIAAAVFLVRNRWAGLSFASLLTSYGGYAFWRFFQESGWHWAQPGGNLGLGAAFLGCYWAVFTAATFLSKSERLAGAGRATFLTLNNGAYFALFLLTMLQVRTGGFWMFCMGYGAVLLALAVLARRLLPSEPMTMNAYLTHGLVLVTLGVISKFAGLQLAMVLGAESVVLYLLGTQRPSLVLKVFAYLAAFMAAGWAMAGFQHFDSPGLWTGAGLGGLLAFNAVWANRKQRDNSAPLRGEPATFTVLALLVWLATTWFNTTEAQFPLALATEALALTFSFYVFRAREITLLGQFFLILGHLAWLVHFLNAPAPWWNPLAIIAVTIGLSHWWQFQKILPVSRNIFVCYATLFALSAVGITLVWVHPLVSAPAWLAATSLLALGATAYGLLTRAWPLALCAQVFLAVSSWEFFRQLFSDKPAWYSALAPVIALIVLSLGTVAWFLRKPGSAPEGREPLLQTALAYRWLALAQSLFWMWIYVPERHRVWACMAAAAAVFGLGVWRKSIEALAASMVFATASLALLWMRGVLVMDTYWPNLLALVALLAMQQILRRMSEKLAVPEKIHGAIIVIAGVSLWQFLSCCAGLSGFFVTMAWAGFAVVMFGAGILLHERFLRWFGLGVLAAAVGRLVLVDVWKQETGYRVLTFLALGIALLVVGFVYNRYQEKIRQWM